jgi:hypothetical protein
MTKFLSSIHLQTTAVVATEVAGLTAAQAWIAPATGGWTSVYDESAEDGDPEVTAALAEALSKSLQVPALSFIVFNDRSFLYTLHNKGSLVEQRVITNHAEAPPNTSKLARYCSAGTDLEKILYGAEWAEAERPAHAQMPSSDSFKAMLDESAQMLRSMSPDAVEQLFDQVKTLPGVDPNHPLLTSFHENRQAVLEQLAHGTTAMQAEGDRVLPQRHDAPEPPLSDAGSRIPRRLEALAASLGLSDRMALTFSSIDPGQDSWHLVAAEP